MLTRRPRLALRALLGAVLGLAAITATLPVDAQGRKPPAGKPTKPKRDPPIVPVLPGAPRTGLSGGLDALEHSDYATAEKELTAANKGADKQKASLGLARLYLTVGKYKEAVDAADQAFRSGKTKERLDAAAFKAKALAAQGKMTEAVAAVEAVKDDPDARRARIVLGELLIAQGKSADARDPLMTLVSDYNSDAIAGTDGEGLALVGRSAHLLRHAQDANDAYMQAEHAPPARVETLLWRAELFLDKFDTGHAEEVIRDALKIAPANPDARVLLARIKLDQSLDFDAAEANIKKALAVNPRHTGAFAVRAGVALRDFDLAAADAAIDEGLRTNPVDLPLLSMRAAVRLLADDRPGFDAARKKVLAVNAEYSSMYSIIGEFADWEHRYDDIVNMMKEAVAVDPRDGKAWAVLGLNQIRLGDDTNALDSLRKAWTFDKFNPRVLNTLNLYEKDIPTKYETVDAGHFKYRFDKNERPVLERYIPPMLEEAFTAMVAHYGMTPTLPIGIELYSNREHFSVRTSGLPNVGIQGVCFGRTLAAPSPGGEAFNWGNVLWHELGHVFAIQLSKAHVPRWFTEGLSEYETFMRRAEWQREEDQALYSAMVAGRIPKLANFNRAFTHAEDVSDVTMAYYAASQVVTYIGEKYGMPKIAEMLKLWGQGVRDPEVIQRGLGISFDELEKQFRVWLEPRLVRYRKQFVPDLHAPSLEDAIKAAQASPNDLRKQIELAIAAAGANDEEKAVAALAAANRINANDAHVRYLNSKMALAKKDLAGAQKILETMVRDKQDGFTVRMQLADLAEAAKDTRTMRAHLEAARRFDPVQTEPLQALYDLAKKEKRIDDQIAALRELSILDQHERRVYRRLMEALAEKQNWDEVAKVGARAVFVDVASPIVHRLYGMALSKTNQRDKAIFELESALLCSPKAKDGAAIYAELARLYKAAGQVDKSKAAEAEAARLGSGNAESKPPED
ncbi:MAG: tetratricopeptide repeat protein [Deltaproteobacteria bacterium]|nr:tetratricopeptide repeat protein [Deltaproteobacteria bacterium]